MTGERPPLATPPAEVVYRRLRRGFEAARAARSDALYIVRCAFAGRPVRLRVIGGGDARALLRPFEHLRRPPLEYAAARPALTIDVWDEAATGVRAEGCAAAADRARPAVISTSEGDRWVSRRKARLWTAFDRRAGHLVGWMADARRLSLHQRSSPFLSELTLWYRDLGIQPVHAAVVVSDGRAVLLGGPSGCGKTTLLLSCLRAGFRWLGDDYVGLAYASGTNRAGAGPTAAPATAHSLYASLLLERDRLARFPELSPHVVPVPGRLPTESKTFVLLPDVHDAVCARSAPIHAIALPRPGTTRPLVRRAAPTETLLRLAPTSLRLLPGARVRHGLRRLAALVERTPAYWLSPDPDPVAVHTRLARVLDDTAASTPAGC